MSADTASHETLVEHYQLVTAGTAHDMPGVPIPSFETVRAVLLTSQADEVLGHWHARDAGRLIGVLRVEFPLVDELSTKAYVEARVYPEYRRRGVATALLRAAVPAIRERKRDVVVVRNVPNGSPAAAAGTALGFDVEYASVTQVLTVPSVDTRTWDVRAPAGYRVETWIGSVPAEHLASYAVARNAVHDAPSRGASSADIAWTPDRVRSHAEDLARGRVEQRIAAAIHEHGKGAVVGFSLIQIDTRRPDFASQGDTAVRPDHRGRGLGVVLKAAQLRRLVAERPEVTEVVSSVAQSNGSMLRVNRRVGYTDFRKTANIAQPAERLTARLNDLGQ